MAWLRMMGRDSVEYHRETVMNRADDRRGLVLAYYDERGESPMRWAGEGCADLGLRGEVTPETYEAMFGVGGARHPVTGERLVATTRPGMELVVAAHKSVAELGVLGHVGDMHKILDAERIATMQWLEGLTIERGGRRGRAQRPAPTYGLIYAHTRHATSRAGDPNPHDHVLMANVVLMDDEQGGWKGAHTALWREDVHAATIAGRMAAARVAVEAGYSVSPDDGSSGRLRHWRIDGIPDEVLDLHSKRAAQIDEAVEIFGYDTWHARQTAARTTRDRKEHEPPCELTRRWQRELASIGWDVDRLDAAVREAGHGYEPPGALTDFELDQLVANALAHDSALSRQKIFRLADVVIEVGPDLYGRPIEELERAVGAVLQAAECVPLVIAGGAKERHYATASVLANEVAIARLIDEGMSRNGPAVSDDVLTAVLTQPVAQRLTDGQRRAVAGICGDGREVSLVLGLAGTGKTTATRFAAAAFATGGYRVLGGATSGQAARTLGTDAGIDARTIASLRWNLEHDRLRLDRKTVVVLDEAGMTDDPDMVFVLAATQRSRAKVILVGDDRQLGPVGPGGAFGAILERHRPAVYVLDGNIRQHDPGEAAALSQLRDGDVADAVSWYAGHGRIDAQPDRDTALAATVEGWAADVRAGKNSAIYAWKRSNVDALNHLARQAWADAGTLDGPEVTAPGGRRYRAGDQVIALAPAQGRLVTSERATVTAVDQRTGHLQVETGDHRTFTLAREETAADRLDHAYAVTVHRAQGATVDRAHRFEDGGGRELAYVALSRAREHTTVHVVADDLDQAVEHLNDLWHRDARPRWAIDQAAPDNLTHRGNRFNVVMTAADQARHRALATLDPSQHVRDLHRRLLDLENERADLLAGTGRWESTPVGEAVRALAQAREARRDAYQNATRPGASRWERRRWHKEERRLEQALSMAVDQRDQLIEPELDPLDDSIAALQTEHTTAQLDATTRQLTERLRHLEHGVSVGKERELSGVRRSRSDGLGPSNKAVGR